MLPNRGNKQQLNAVYWLSKCHRSDNRVDANGSAGTCCKQVPSHLWRCAQFGTVWCFQRGRKHTTWCEFERVSASVESIETRTDTNTGWWSHLKTPNHPLKPLVDRLILGWRHYLAPQALGVVSTTHWQAKLAGGSHGSHFNSCPVMSGLGYGNCSMGQTPVVPLSNIFLRSSVTKVVRFW